MIQIRSNVFETNSSSTHALVMCTESIFEDFKNNKVFYIEKYSIYSKFNRNLFSIDEILLMSEIDDTVKEILRGVKQGNKLSYEDIDFLKDYDVYTLKYFTDDEQLEYFMKKFNCPDGITNVVAFGFYGNNY